MDARAPDQIQRGSRQSIPALGLRLVPALFLIGWVVAALFVNPAEYPSWYRCPFHSTTGWYCAGCGSTRATHMLVRGDIVASLGQNPLVLVLGVPAAAWVVYRCFRPESRTR
ncbi:MAG: DUF2752 domain-containing protein, partial [Phycisphaerales bacterium JB061]